MAAEVSMTTMHARFLVSTLAIAIGTTALAQDARDDQDRPLPNLAEIKADLEELRGLPFKRDVPAKVQTLEGWGAYLDAALESSFPEEKQKDMLDGILRFGLLTEEIDLATELKDAMLSQAGAYYDPETKTFYYLMVDMHIEALKTIAAHELVHALQDQHFGLEEIMQAFEEVYTSDVRNDDSMLAFRMLVEGEATYVHTLWQMNAMGMDLHANPQAEKMQLKMMADMEISQLVDMAAGMQGAAGGGAEDEDNAIAKAMREMNEIPPYILHPLYAAYMQGAYFTMSLRHEGGWEGIAKAFDSVPQSAEQAIHPEKYLEEGRDEPTVITLGDSHALTSAGWKRIDSSISGEFYLGLLLKNYGVKSADAKQAAAGWDGDVYQAYRDETGTVGYRLATTWDTEDDAQEFYAAAAKMLQGRYSEARMTTRDDETTVSLADADGSGHGSLLVRGREVFLVDGLPAALVAPVLMEMTAAAITYVD
jgi:hypothetical protein